MSKRRLPPPAARIAIARFTLLCRDVLVALDTLVQDADCDHNTPADSLYISVSKDSIERARRALEKIK